MTKKSSLYTKSGDKGETSLVSGNRVKKSDTRINLYGEVDELNSWIGLLLSKMGDSSPEDSEVLKMVQHKLFDLGSNLACEEENRSNYKLPQISIDNISKLETRIDIIDASLEKMKTFILPGGVEGSSVAHLVRTKTRKVERDLISFSENEVAPDNSIEFLNRLSDYAFALARLINKLNDISDIKWEKGK